MGRSRRDQPLKLARKLRAIRTRLGLTQVEMAANLRRSAKGGLQPGHISEYEHGKRQPSLVTLLKYARIAGVAMEVLVDDAIDLPSKSVRRK